MQHLHHGHARRRPGHRPEECRLTQRARADLIDIYDFTEGKFGAYQAEAYHAGLVRSFGLLADFPLIGQTFDELAAGYRRFRFQSHTLCGPTTSKFVPWFTVPKTSGGNFSSRR
ncbi:type II toxin-antitoxin system RelE/ParE family toxin [Bradyrhizobium sp. AUGA SZCCT0283]|uniref:type II toxin-antitoxin system RelE/ParE family toxin n=1 Tax=Bradyrhizobium sp. AUGA SZCCT0283 TaxID=2807671 RepID=UPI00201217B6|nr:type II toxin-antitoxin system RelE/ParE family toxin [Bradyrhizobium sp. AUGA SZCCT0283]